MWAAGRVDRVELVGNAVSGVELLEGFVQQSGRATSRNVDTVGCIRLW